MNCCNCGKDVHDWNCSIESAKAAGGKVIAPNNLPIRCIMADGTMLECEHGDHVTYMFPVDVIVPEQDGADMHALIYTDGCIALTLYECRYFMWRLRDGTSISNPQFCDGQTLSESSREKIQALRKM